MARGRQYIWSILHSREMVNESKVFYVKKNKRVNQMNKKEIRRCLRREVCSCTAYSAAIPHHPAAVITYMSNSRGLGSPSQRCIQHQTDSFSKGLHHIDNHCLECLTLLIICLIYKFVLGLSLCKRHQHTEYICFSCTYLN